MTSHLGPLTIDEGAEAPVYLALLPAGEQKVKGKYVWNDKAIREWNDEVIEEWNEKAIKEWNEKVIKERKDKAIKELNGK